MAEQLSAPGFSRLIRYTLRVFHELQPALEGKTPESPQRILELLGETKNAFERNIQPYISVSTLPPGLTEEELFGKISEVNALYQSLVLEVPSSTVVPTTTCTTVPTFHGDYISWPRFRDNFMILVHHQPALTSIEKLKHLLDATTGPAREIVAKFPLLPDQYEKAWVTLCDTYNSKRKYSAALLNRLFNPLTPPFTATRSHLQYLLDNIVDTGEALLNLGVNHIASFLVFTIVLQHVDDESRDLFKEAYACVDFPTLTELKHFLKKRYQTLNTTQKAPQPGCSTYSSSFGKSSISEKEDRIPPPNMIPGVSYVQNDDSNHRFTSPKDPRIYGCEYCSGNHSIRKCAMFMILTVDQRLQFVTDSELCLICMSVNHETVRCMSPIVCEKCTRKHHTLLHCTNVSQVNFNFTSTSSAPKIEPPSPSPSSYARAPVRRRASLSPPMKRARSPSLQDP